jgi:hypothetical protein
MFFSLRDVAASSYSGAKDLQWPHHGAKNSARTSGFSLMKEGKVSAFRSWTSDAEGSEITHIELRCKSSNAS